MNLEFKLDYVYFKNGCFNCEIHRCIELQNLIQYYEKKFFDNEISQTTFLRLTQDFRDEVFEIKRSCDKLEAERNLRSGNK